MSIDYAKWFFEPWGGGGGSLVLPNNLQINHIKVNFDYFHPPLPPLICLPPRH